MYKSFNPNEIKPSGWLREQLVIQANGLSGNLDKMWPDIKDSAWIGGDKEGWERVPYWLDGFIPLAFLLDDDDMKCRAQRYIYAIIERQDDDGWICPCTEEERKTYDVWALFLIGKVLALFCDFTGDELVQTALYRAMRLLAHLLENGEIKLFDWGKFRWFEALIPLQFLYDHYHEDWIIALGKLIREQGAHYPSFKEQWERPLNRWTFQTHIVNLCMMFKYEALCCKLFGEPYENQAQKLWKIIEKYNSTAVGTFTGDECLSGIGNTQGTELCSVAELMYSCEILYAATGDNIWAERLEKAAFNALPATLSDDMWTHQYDQLVNQIACVRFETKPVFRTNGNEAHLFGLEPNFGCCTANFNQAWPKLAQNVFLKSEKGIVAALMLPATLKTKIGTANITVKNETQYPWRHRCEYTITTDSPVNFELKIRIPKWTKSLRVNGKDIGKKSYYRVKKLWEGTETITIDLSDTPHLVKRPNRMKVVQYGPLVFALPIEAQYEMSEYESNGVQRKYPYCDYELYPQSQWRYGFSSGEFTVCEQEGDSVPFSSKQPRLLLRAQLYPINWDYADGYETVSANTPISNMPVGELESKILYPYGCSKLRITEIPMCKT